MFLFSPVAILVINRSLHAQKPRQDVDKNPESQSEALANVLWPMRGPTCVSRVSLCGSPGSGSEYWAPPPSLRCCNIKIHQIINQKWGTGELSRGERGIDEAKVRLETNRVFVSVCKVWEMEVNLHRKNRGKCFKSRLFFSTLLGFRGADCKTLELSCWMLIYIFRLSVLQFSVIMLFR